MIIDIVTLFPETIKAFLSESIIGRAIKNEYVVVNLFNLRDFSTDKHHKVDDTPYGGGSGMVLTCQPIFDAIKALKKEDSVVILMTPQGITYNQDTANYFLKHRHLIIICGHYEGFDERIRSIVDLEISVGDYVLTGGEIPAMIIVDSVVRLIEGVIDLESHQNDSFSNWMLEHPQYTKPRIYEGLSVPDVLLNGNHQEIEKYRKKESIRRTLLKRPDLFKKRILDAEEKKILECVLEEIKKN